MNELLQYGGSHAFTRERFGRVAAATKYPDKYSAAKARDRREVRAILRAFSYLPVGSTVLDLPCGVGRGSRLLLQQGFQVIAADSSMPMLEQARINLQPYTEQTAASLPPRSFLKMDVLQTGCPDDFVAAVFCNRLFHHFSEAETRVQALSELRRICSGPVVVSFFNRFAFDAVYRRLRNRILGRKPVDRIPIKRSVFEGEMMAAGFQIRDRIAVRWGVSPLWYIVAD